MRRYAVTVARHLVRVRVRVRVRARVRVRNGVTARARVRLSVSVGLGLGLGLGFRLGLAARATFPPSGLTRASIGAAVAASRSGCASATCGRRSTCLRCSTLSSRRRAAAACPRASASEGSPSGIDHGSGRPCRGHGGCGHGGRGPSRDGRGGAGCLPDGDGGRRRAALPCATASRRASWSWVEISHQVRSKDEDQRILLFCRKKQCLEDVYESA